MTEDKLRRKCEGAKQTLVSWRNNVEKPYYEVKGIGSYESNNGVRVSEHNYQIFESLKDALEYCDNLDEAVVYMTMKIEEKRKI